MFGRRAKRKALDRSLTNMRQRSAQQLAELPGEWVHLLGPDSVPLADAVGVDYRWPDVSAHKPPEPSIEWAHHVSRTFGSARARYQWDNKYPMPAGESPVVRRLQAVGTIAYHVNRYGLRYTNFVWSNDEIQPAFDTLARSWGLPVGELERTIAVSTACLAIAHGATHLLEPFNLVDDPTPNEVGRDMCFDFRRIRGSIDEHLQHMILDVAKVLARGDYDSSGFAQ